MSASVERGMRESGVHFARAVLSELDAAGVLNCSLASALKLFDFESVAVTTKRSEAAKAKRAKELSSKPKKAKSSRTAKPGMILPFCGKIVSDWCCAVRLNHGLHTQCTNARIADGEYCKTCTKAAANSATSKPPYGDIRERADAGLNYRDPKGRQTLPYANVAAKLKLDLTKAAEAAKACGWEIPAEHLVKRSVKRGRPGKSAAVSDTDSDASTTSKKLKKKLKIKKKAKSQSDLIAKLVAEAGEQLLSDSDGESVSSANTTSSQQSSKKVEKMDALKSEILELCEKHSLEAEASGVSEMKTLKALRAQLKVVKAATKLAEKEAAKAAKAAEKEAAQAAKATKLAEKEAAKATKLAEKEAAQAAKLAEKEAAQAAKLAEKEAAKATKLAEKEAAKAAKAAEKEAAKAAKAAEAEAAKEEKQRQKLVKQLAKLGVDHTETTGTPLSALEGLLKLELARRETEKATKAAAKAAKVAEKVVKLKAQLSKLSPQSPALAAELTPKALRAEIAKVKAEKAAAQVVAQLAPQLEAEAVSCESEASEDEAEDEAEVEVVEKEIDGVTYLYDESGGFAGIPHLVLTTEQEPVGVYDPEQDHVVFQEFEVEE